MVLAVHADFFALGYPTGEGLQSDTASTVTRIAIESLTIVCVNVFVLISGWFRIKPSAKGFLNFIFQCLFFYVGIYVVMVCTGIADMSLKGIAKGILHCFGLLPGSWFIKAYILLYILSPFLNDYCEKASNRQLGIITLAFYAFQTIYGCTGAVTFFEDGYSTISLVGLYLLAQWAKRYRLPVYKFGGVIYLVCCLLLTIICIVILKLGLPFSFWMMKIYGYNNPLVVLASLSFFLWFTTFKIKHNKFINWISASSFAVYLVHVNPNIVRPIYCPAIKQIYDNYNGPVCLLMIFLFLAAIFVSAIAVDQIRKYCWTFVGKRLKVL